VGSSGTKEALAIGLWPRCSKNLRKAARISVPLRGLIAISKHFKPDAAMISQRRFNLLPAPSHSEALGRCFL
jgi:hypothetical protein